MAYQADEVEQRRKNFERLTSNGVYVRGHESCHAKFAVVDNVIGLAGSANFVSKGFEWTGEANVVVRDPAHVRQLARLFTALWFDGCRWEVPPGETYHVAQRQASLPPVTPERPDVRAAGVVWTNGAGETYLHQCICDIIARAKEHLTLASYSVTGMSEKPHLLIQPLREALALGVSVRLFTRQKNPNKLQRADLCSLSDMGVEIFGDLRNHAKGVIADGLHGALFSCNFDGQHGLDSGVEVGVRLDGQSALKDLEDYFQHVMRHGNARYMRNPTLGELDGRLAAKWCKSWPLAHDVKISCSRDAAERFLAHAKEGPVLFEIQGSEVRVFAGQVSLVLEKRGDGDVSAVEVATAVVGATERLESWLVSVQRRNADTVDLERGFCPARIEFSVIG